MFLTREATAPFRLWCCVIYGVGSGGDDRLSVFLLYIGCGFQNGPVVVFCILVVRVVCLLLLRVCLLVHFGFLGCLGKGGSVAVEVEGWVESGFSVVVEKMFGESGLLGTTVFLKMVESGFLVGCSSVGYLWINGWWWNFLEAWKLGSLELWNFGIFGEL